MCDLVRERLHMHMRYNVYVMYIHQPVNVFHEIEKCIEIDTPLATVALVTASDAGVDRGTGLKTILSGCALKQSSFRYTMTVSSC